MRPTRSTERWPWLAGALAFAALWWLFDLLVLRAGVPDRLDDTWEYGVVARSLLDGHGFRTSVIHPPLWALRDSAFTVPVLVHGPLVPLLLAPFIALFGPGALDGMAWLAAAGAFAAVPPIVRLGERCGSGAIGFAAALIWTAAPLTLHAVHHDVSLTLGAALLVAALERLTHPAGPGAGARFVTAGIALGLACLARHELLAALPLFALAAGSAGWLVLAGAALCLLPWWLHHAIAVGQPLFNLSSYLAIGYWGSRPGLSVMRDFSLGPDRFAAAFAAAWPAILAKWAAFAPHAIKRALLAPVPALGWLAVLGATFAIATRAHRRGALLMAAVAMIPIAVMTVTLYDDRYLVPFLPLMALAVARAAHDLAERLPRWARRPRAWNGLLVLALLPAAGPALREETAEARRNESLLARERIALHAWRQRLDAAPREPALVFSDTPDFVAWTTGRPALWITGEEFARLPADPAATGLPARAEAARTWFHSPDSGVSR